MLINYSYTITFLYYQFNNNYRLIMTNSINTYSGSCNKGIHSQSSTPRPAFKPPFRKGPDPKDAPVKASFRAQHIEQICLNRTYHEIRSNGGKIKDFIVTIFKVIVSTGSFICNYKAFSTQQIEKEVKKTAIESYVKKNYDIDHYFTNAATIPYEQQPGLIKKFLVNPAKAMQNGINPASPLPQIENATWYLDYVSWTAPIPEGVNTVNLFVGEITQTNGTYTMGGMGTFSSAGLTTFVQQCHTQGISVKFSIGGCGGMYDNCWDILTASNVQAVAQGMVDFCHQYGLDGVDFDYEEFQGQPQEQLVGQLIKNFKAIDNTLQTSLCCNAGFSSWDTEVQNILDAAVDGSGKCAVDRLYIMAYFNTITDEEGWITQWASWLNTRYSFDPSQVTIGLDDSGAYSIPDFAQWAYQQGFSTGYWSWDPLTQDQSNSIAQEIWDIYHPSKKAF